MMNSAYGGGHQPRSRRDRTLSNSDPFELVESATNELLYGKPAWDVNIALVDILSAYPNEAPAVLELLKKKIMSHKHEVGLLAVILLETLVKNCTQLHPLVGTRDFMEVVLVKSLPRSVRKPNQGPSLNSLINEPSDIKSPMAILRWEHILKCIAAWSQAFDPTAYPIFREVHRMLERRGVRFPVLEKGDENAPVFLPDKPATAQSSPSAPSPQNRSAGAGADVPAGVNIGGVSANALSDIRTGLESAKLLKQCVEGAEVGFPLDQDELIQQLYASCRSSSEILSRRLTKYANDESIDEKTTMSLISTIETVQEAIKIYTDALTGVRPASKPAGSASSSGPSRQFRQALQESKEDHEYAHRRGPVHESPAKSAIPQASAPEPVVRQKTRRKSDLPPELTQFDMLGISESPPTPQPQYVERNQPAPQTHLPHNIDPFSSSQFPASSAPSALSVVTSTPNASTPTPSSAKASKGLIAPPPSSTRHRGDKSGKRSSGGHDDHPVLGLAPSPAKPHATTPNAASNSPPVGSSAPPVSNLFDLDSLMNANPPQNQTTPQRAFPYPANNPSTLPRTNPALQQQTSPNPFESFDDGSADPFAQIATRSTPAPKQQSSFGF